MKIETMTTSQPVTGIQSIKVASHEKVNEFQNLLQEVTQDKKQEIKESEEKGFEQLLDELNETKEKLEKDLTSENLDAYKEKVKEALNHYQEHAFKKETHEWKDRKGQTQKTMSIQLVSEKMNGLTAELLQSHFGQLTLLRRVGELHGLLVNVMV